MSTTHVEAMIDHLVERYGLDDAVSGAGARGLCLKWIQLSEEEAWGAGEWWFKQQRIDQAMTGGQTDYAPAVNNNRIHAVEQGAGAAMTRLHPDDFRELCGDDATSGYPEIWCALEPSSTGYPRFKVWPVPTGVETLKVVYDAAAKVLEDAEDSVSGFPADWRHLVLLRAEAYASLHQGQQGQAQGFLGEYGAQLTALGALNSSQMVRV